MLLARNVNPTSGANLEGTIRPAAPATNTVATTSRFSPRGRRWI